MSKYFQSHSHGYDTFHDNYHNKPKDLLKSDIAYYEEQVKLGVITQEFLDGFMDGVKELA